MRCAIFITLITLNLFAAEQNSVAELSSAEIDQLLIAYKSRLDALDNAEDKMRLVMQNYPADKIYKLFIDKARLQKPSDTEKQMPPHLIFDVKEPGYYDAMSNAMKALPRFIGKRMRLDTIVALHDLAVANVRCMKNDGSSSGMAIGLSNAPCKYRTQFNLGAYGELFNSQILYDSQSLLSHFIDRDGISDKAVNFADEFFKDEWNAFLAESKRCGIDFISSLPKSSAEMDKRVDALFDHYYSSISTKQSLMSRLSAVGELLRAFEVAHFLPDGNQRTYAFLLLPKLLIENGIPLALLDDPYMFDGFLTVEQMAIRLKKGIINFFNESPGQQRLFLAMQYENNSRVEPNIWLSKTEKYDKYSESRNYSAELISRFRHQVDQACKSGNVDEKTNGLSPLDAAVLLGSIDLIDDLIAKGARGVKSSISLALRLAKFQIADHLLQISIKQESEQLGTDFITQNLVLAIDASNNPMLVRLKNKALLSSFLIGYCNFPGAET